MAWNRTDIVRPLSPSASLKTPANTRFVVIYARVSSKEQKGFSIPAQLKLLRSYAASAGFKVAQEFVDVETAKQSGRPGFGGMLACLSQHFTLCRAVLVEKTDRLYRNFRDYVTLDEHDLELHFVKENVVLSRELRSNEKFIHGIKVLMAKNYIDNLSEEVRKGLQEGVESGIWRSFRPLGYRNVEGPNGKKIIEPDPELALAISRLFDRYAQGDISLKQAAKLSRPMGLVFRKTKNPIPTSTVQRILRNRIYTGEFDYKGRTYPGIHVGIVSKKKWNLVQLILDRRLTGREKKRRHEFAFSGVVTCGHCDCAMVGELKKRQYVYYHRTGFKGKCPEPYVREEVLEKHFSALLRQIDMGVEVRNWIEKALRESFTEQTDFHAESLRALRSEYDRLQARIEAMYEDKLDGKIDVDFFQRQSAAWRIEQARTKEAIDEHENANQNYLEQGVQLLDFAHRSWREFESAPSAHRQKLLNFLLLNSSWRDGKLTATFAQPFEIIGVARAKDEAAPREGGLNVVNFDNWRRGRDSNPRDPCEPTGLANRPVRPLRHLSAVTGNGTGHEFYRISILRPASPAFFFLSGCRAPSVGASVPRSRFPARAPQRPRPPALDRGFAPIPGLGPLTNSLPVR